MPAEPSWLTLKRHLLATHRPRRLVKSIRDISLNDRKDEFKQARLFQTVAKIPISNTHSGVAEMDLVDYGDDASLLRTRDNFSRYPTITFASAKKARAEPTVDWRRRY